MDEPLRLFSKTEFETFQAEIRRSRNIVRFDPADQNVEANANPIVQQRSRTPEAPYCWQAKVARRSIYEHFDGDTFGASCLGVYDALTEIASDKEAETFTTPQSHIAQKSCLGFSTVKKAIKELRSLSLIAYETPKLREQLLSR
jgi:hypothetical protein